jgi:DNA-binding NtrC family response regulator
MNQDRLRILLIDDDEDDYIITRDLLAEINYPLEKEHKWQLDWAATYEAGREAIDQAQYDVYLVDFRLGPHNGLDLIQESMAHGCAAPLILLTGQGDRAVDLEAMQAGAADYLVKGQLDAPLLERSIRYALGRKRSEAQIQRRNRELALLNQVIAASAAGLALDAILEIACRELALTFNVPRVTALLLNDDRTSAVIAAQYVESDTSSLIGLAIPI